MKTVVGLFDDMAQAKNAALDLEKVGIPHNDISIVANNEGGRYVANSDTTDSTTVTGHAIGKDALVGAEIGGVSGLILGLTGFAIPGLGWIAGAGWLMGMLLGAGAGAVIGGLVGALTSVGVPEEDAAHYNEGVHRGGILLAVKAQDNIAHQAAQILSDDGAVNIDERAAQYQAAPAVTTAQTAAPAPAPRPVPAPTPAASVAQTANREGQAVLPVVEEELAVGKREVQRGGVRVYTHVTERPVEEQVQLREEHVSVDRRPVDRPVNPADINAFKEGTIEITETAEVPVVSKQAHVVEEVLVGKETQQRTETVTDSVRRTDVEVEQLTGRDHDSRTRGFDSYVGAYRSDFQRNYSDRGTYEQYEPAYRYGYDISSKPAYRGRDWASIEPEIRRDWETRQPNSWDRFRNSIRYAWDQATGAERGGIQTGGHAIDGTPDTRGVTEKISDAITGDHIDDKTGKVVR